MRIATLEIDGADAATVVTPAGDFVPLAAIAPDLPGTVLEILRAGLTPDIRERLVAGAARAGSSTTIRAKDAFLRPLLRPGKMLGIGLNYRDHASDLSAPFPETPASFFKAGHTIIGPGQDIIVPEQSDRTTAEGELGIVFGKECWQVEPDDALNYVAGVCAILDQTAEDILELNPRFLTRSKNFPTFLSLGETLVTVDEVLEVFGDLSKIPVSTILNDDVIRKNTVAAMAYGPEALVSFHSKVMPFQPGDVISTGTPGAAQIKDGDVVRCDINGLVSLSNPVRKGH